MSMSTLPTCLPQEAQGNKFLTGSEVTLAE
jgi:hypothetical protein